jgi:hypothetical protein
LLPWEIIGAAANTGDVEHGEAFAHGYETWKLWPELLSNFPCVSTRSTSASETLAQTDELKQSSEKPCCIWNSVGEDGLAAAAVWTAASSPQPKVGQINADAAGVAFRKPLSSA